jgi:hypothetical protein
VSLYLLAKCQFAILLTLSFLFPLLAAHIHILSDLLFGPWCHTDNLSDLYSFRKFSTMFQKAHHWMLSWTSRIYFTLSRPISPICLIISVPYTRSLDAFRPKFCTNFPVFPCVLCLPPLHLILRGWLTRSMAGVRRKKIRMLGKC